MYRKNWVAFLFFFFKKKGGGGLVSSTNQKIKRGPANREKGEGDGSNKGLTSNNIENGVTKVKKASTELMP